VKDDAGVTLIEVLVAAMLIGLALAPLMQLYPGILAADEESDMEMRLGTEGIRKLEQLITDLRNDIDGAVSGAEACPEPDPDPDPAPNFPGCWLEWTIDLDQPPSGTPEVGVLKRVGVIACVDANGNLICESGELQVRFDAKVTSRP